MTGNNEFCYNDPIMIRVSLKLLIKYNINILNILSYRFCDLLRSVRYYNILKYNLNFTVDF